MWYSFPICYFCNLDLRDRYTSEEDDIDAMVLSDFLDVKLADKCTVHACHQCYTQIEEGKKVAQENGHYDPNLEVGGGERMKIEKGATGGSNLTVDFVTEKKITRLKIINEGEMVTYTPKEDGKKPTTKLVVGVDYEGRTKEDPDKWSLNNKSRNALIDIYGDDTAAWVNKEPEITISGEGEYKHIMVDTLRTK